nr:MAG TPA: hypothetical protein [Caudoviricetes sp.]
MAEFLDEGWRQNGTETPETVLRQRFDRRRQKTSLDERLDELEL